MVSCTSIALVGINTSHHRCLWVFWQLLGNVDRKVVFLLGIDDFDGFELTAQYTCITYLTTTFCIERSVAQYDLVESLVLLLHLTVAENRSFVFSIVVTHEVGFAFVQGNPVASFYGSRITGTFLLLLHFGLEFFFVYGHAVFAENQFGQVEWEAECIVKCKAIYTADFSLTGSLRFVHGLFEQTDTSFEGAEE